MNIYETMLEDANVKTPDLYVVETLEKYKAILDRIRDYVVEHWGHFAHTCEQMWASDHSVAYIQEFIERERESYETSAAGFFEKRREELRAGLEVVKKKIGLVIGNGQAARNNLAKVQAALQGMNIEDKEQLFKAALEKEPSLLSVLYFNVKNESPLLVEQIKAKMDGFTGASAVDIVRQQCEQIESLGSYLSYDMVKGMGEAYTAMGDVDTTFGGTVDRIIQSFYEDIDKKIVEAKALLGWEV